MQCTLFGESEERKIRLLICQDTLFYPEDERSRFLQVIITYLWNYTAVTSQRTVILCSVMYGLGDWLHLFYAYAKSIRSGQQVCVWYWSVCNAHYVGTRWGGQGEPLTLWKYYSTLVWLITHASFTAFSSYDTCTQHTVHVIWPISLMKQRLVSHQYTVLQGTEKAQQILDRQT